MKVDERRVRSRNDAPIAPGAVVYWMQRDQRAEDNWALLYAQQCALERQVPLYVVFNLVPIFGNTTLRHYDFMFAGLKQVESDLEHLQIPFVLLQGTPTETILQFVDAYHIGEVVTDFNPLRFTDEWRKKVGGELPVRLTEVDAHNVVPCWEASDKEEFAAHTFRPKVHKKLKEYLTSFPSLKTHPYKSDVGSSQIDWDALLDTVDTDREVKPVDWITAGTQAAKIQAQKFISEQLDVYAEERNDPNKNALSNLSPYLHFGQLSPQWLAYEVNNIRGVKKEGKESYFEELVVRRELTDNFCFYNKNYDKVEGAHAWAQKTIQEHVADTREYEYERKVLEAGKTHDELWNAMQTQMVREGKMHGWCRMYWAKKILEWSPDVQTAIDRALYLNDKYELDGTDPNGIVGVMWSICGVHDRAWTERPIFGKIRYMNLSGAKRKFDINAFIAKYSPEERLFND